MIRLSVKCAKLCYFEQKKWHNLAKYSTIMGMNKIKTSDNNAKKLGELENMFSQSFALLQSLSEGQKAYIHRQVLISTIGASTRIENAVLTDQEIEWIDTVLTADAKTTSFQQNKNLIENKLSKDKERIPGASYTSDLGSGRACPTPTGCET